MEESSDLGCARLNSSDDGSPGGITLNGIPLVYGNRVIDPVSTGIDMFANLAISSTLITGPPSSIPLFVFLLLQLRMTRIVCLERTLLYLYSPLKLRTLQEER